MASSSSKAEPTNGSLDAITPEVAEAMKQLEADINEAERITLQHHIKLMKPIYARRREILAKIPKFWPQTLVKHVVVAQFLAYDDYEVIQHLTDLFIEREEGNVDHYKIILKFSENPYIKNSELVKEYNIDDAGHQQTKSTRIEWHEGKDFTKKRRQDEEHNSFFKWFSSNEDNPSNPSWDLGKYIRDELFPKAYQWYLHDEEDELDIEEFGEDDELSEDDDDDESELPPPNKRIK